MSSGYSSLEEDSEEYFFTARTSFLKKPSGKLTEPKVCLKVFFKNTSTDTQHANVLAAFIVFLLDTNPNDELLMSFH